MLFVVLFIWSSRQLCFFHKGREACTRPSFLFGESAVQNAEAGTPRQLPHLVSKTLRQLSTSRPGAVACLTVSDVEKKYSPNLVPHSTKVKISHCVFVHAPKHSAYPGTLPDTVVSVPVSKLMFQIVQTNFYRTFGFSKMHELSFLVGKLHLVILTPQLPFLECLAEHRTASYRGR